jgi:cyanate lyase
MCANTRYTTKDDQLIVEVVESAKNKCTGFEKVAKKLGRSETAIMQRYYNRLLPAKKRAARKVLKQRAPRTTDKITGAEKAVISVNGVEITVLFK